jgi:halocyanin-like protein
MSCGFPSQSETVLYATGAPFISLCDGIYMRRRNVLRFTCAAGALAVAGCVGDSDDDETTGGGDEGTPTPTPTPEPTEEAENADSGDGDEGGENSEDSDSDTTGEYRYEDPTAAVEAFFQAFHDGDVEALKALVLDDGDFSSETEDMTPEELEEQAPDVKDITLVEEDGDAAEVRAQFVPPGADSAILTAVKLRKVEDAWRIEALEGASELPRVPRATFDFDVEGDTMTITLEAGDSIAAGKLYVRGDGIESTGVWHELAEDSGVGPDDDVVAGDSVTVGVDGEYSIQVVWEGEDSSATLSSISGASETVSADGIDAYLADVSNYDGTIEDFTGEKVVTVEVGAGGPDQPYVFDPPAIRIDTGTTVTWEWTGEAGHSVTHEDGAFESEILEGEGTTFEYTFDEAGQYRYFCAPHKSLGMKGAVVVE